MTRRPEELRSKRPFLSRNNSVPPTRATSRFLPAIAVAIWRQRWRVLRRKIDIFGETLQFRVHQRCLVMFLRDEHVERRNDKQGEDCSNRHSTNEHQTD